MTAAVAFPAPGRIPYPGGCVLEPAPYALDWLLRWAADVVVAGQLHPQTPVAPLLQALLRDPGAHGITLADAQAARDRFLALAGPALEAEGGRTEWLARELSGA
ncbi:hypothetical protein [Deinococcus arcticus]|uniref:Uncharacterized protein n=1 Tax=Deinococcus arcticus TaxID=2136176 RepID=A0A2T3WC70_9DEIO|nr:hypothetical protein [Deinococcus arcticus]PTA69501.1 hypothetical protein C8263_00220 [Deinococcus arcticus]